MLGLKACVITSSYEFIFQVLHGHFYAFIFCSSPLLIFQLDCASYSYWVLGVLYIFWLQAPYQTYYLCCFLLVCRLFCGLEWTQALGNSRQVFLSRSTELYPKPSCNFPNEASNSWIFLPSIPWGLYMANYMILPTTLNVEGITQKYAGSFSDFSRQLLKSRIW